MQPPKTVDFAAAMDDGFIAITDLATKTALQTAQRSVGRETAHKFFQALPW
jgi:hypothetical protein